MSAETAGYDRLLSFISVHDAIRAEAILAAAGIKTMAIPTPREISLSCGQSLLLAAGDEAAALAALREREARWNKLYRRDPVGRVYEKIKQHEG